MPDTAMPELALVLSPAARKLAALTEGADGGGKSAGVEIWRVEDLAGVPRVAAWPTEEYGSFYEGDSYVVLHCTRRAFVPKLVYDVYLGRGKTTPDEMAAAGTRRRSSNTLTARRWSTARPRSTRARRSSRCSRRWRTSRAARAWA